MRILVLLNDAYGGRGGIAHYNRNLLKALCNNPDIKEVVAMPRQIDYEMEKLPDNLTYYTGAVRKRNSYLNYMAKCFVFAILRKRFDLIICSHLHLIPIAYMLSIVTGCKYVPIIYGIDAWYRTKHWMVNRLCSKLDTFISIRKLTSERFIHWARCKNAKAYYLPNCIDVDNYGIAARKLELIEKLNLSDRTVIMTAGRLDIEAREINKGFDEVLEVLPDLRKQIPNLSYLIMGDGAGKQRLSQKAEELGVSDITIFSGYVPESEKADYYRMADVFAMPGSNDLFDRYPYRFVFLEALACGVPVVGCRVIDASEANDADLSLIIQVDPNDREDIKRGIIEALSRPKRTVSPMLQNYYFPAFESQLRGYIKELVNKVSK